MKIGGWRTRSVFERYAIVTQSDIQDAVQKLEAQDVAGEEETTEEKPSRSQPN